MRATTPPINASSTEERMRIRLPTSRSSSVFKAARCASLNARAALNTELERLVGKRIRMRSSVDEALIGGVVARIRSTVYDGSVRGRLRALERRLAMERYS